MASVSDARHHKVETRAAAADAAKGARQGRAKIMDALSQAVSAASNIFQIVDFDGTGTISRSEFCAAILALGVDMPADLRNKCAERLFDEFDTDKSEEISYTEFLRFMLRDSLARSVTKVVDVFKSWDTDESGELTKDEFRRGIAALSYDVPYDELNQVFDEMDANHSGTLSYRELNKQLRQGALFRRKVRRAAPPKDTAQSGEDKGRMPHRDQARVETPRASRGNEMQIERGTEHGQLAPLNSLDRPSTAPDHGRMLTFDTFERPSTAPNITPSTRITLEALSSPSLDGVSLRQHPLHLSSLRRPQTARAHVDAKQAPSMGRMLTPRPPGHHRLHVATPTPRFRGTSALRPQTARAPSPPKFVVRDEQRVRTIQDEQADVAVERTVHAKAVFIHKRTPQAFGGHRWVEPLPSITPEGYPVWIGRDERRFGSTLGSG